MNEISELKPCPFCGSENVSESTGESGGKPWKYIECIDCSAMAELKMWNQRAGLRAGSVTSDAVILASASDPKAASSVLAELRKLEAQATKEPWIDASPEILAEDETVCSMETKLAHQWDADVALIVALRNTALPLLTRQEEALKDLASIIRMLEAEDGAISKSMRPIYQRAKKHISSILDTTQEVK